MVLTAVHAILMTKKTEVRRYRLNASDKRNEMKNDNKTERSAKGHSVFTSNGHKTRTIFCRIGDTEMGWTVLNWDRH